MTAAAGRLPRPRLPRALPPRAPRRRAEAKTEGVTGAPRIRARLLGALTAAAVALVATAASAATPRPSLDSTAAIVTDAGSGAVLFSEHANSRREIGSTTKLMTAYLVLARAKPGDVFTAPAYNATPAESVIGLHKGERMTVHDLLR